MFEASNSGLYRWPLVRVAAGGETVVVLLSSRWLPLTVHWHGRSVLCGGERCPLCAWLPSRGLYYAACSVDARVSMLELGSLSSSLIEQHCGLLHKGMRPGLQLRLWRSSRKAPVHGEVVGEMDGVVGVEAVDLARRVMALYQMPGPNVGEAFSVWEERLCVLARRRGELIAKQLAVACGQGVESRR